MNFLNKMCLIKDAKCGTAVPMNMLCTGCIAFTKGKRFSPHNILFCNSQHPTHTKLSRGEMNKVLEKYFGCPIIQNVNADQVRTGTFTSTQTKKKNSKRNTRSPRTAGTGETIYLTQWIRVGDKPLLVMYDRGSNTNLILGKVAQKGKMQIISDKPRLMTVVGGQTLTTKYRLY